MGIKGGPLGRWIKADHELKAKYRKIRGYPMHRHIVEQRIGFKLPPTAAVHHVDPTDKLTNTGLFVVCQDNAYHLLLERRGRALRECGNANWRQCYRCKKYDDPQNLLISRRRKTRRGDNVGDVVHAKQNGVCSDLPEPIAPDAWTCAQSPSGRHNIQSRKALRTRKRPMLSGLEQRCDHCRMTIRRLSPESVRWYAPNAPSVPSPHGEQA